MTDQAPQSLLRRKWKTVVFTLALLAVAYGLFGREAIHRIKRERAIIRIRQDMGSVVCAEPTYASPTFVVRWLRVFYGPGAFTEAWSVDLRPKNDSDLNPLLQIPEVDSTFDASSLDKISNNSRLLLLGFSNCSLSDSDLAALHGSRSRLTLKLDESCVTENGLIALHNANKSWSIEIAVGPPDPKKARETNLYPSQIDISTIQYLDLRGPKVSDLSLTILKDAVQLNGLLISNCNVTDEGLKELENLGSLEKSLRSIIFSKTAVTDEGKKLLKSAIPECVINGERVNPN